MILKLEEVRNLRETLEIKIENLEMEIDELEEKYKAKRNYRYVEFISSSKTKQLLDILNTWIWEHENKLENNKKKIIIPKEELISRGINFNIR